MQLHVPLSCQFAFPHLNASGREGSSVSYLHRMASGFPGSSQFVTAEANLYYPNNTKSHILNFMTFVVTTPAILYTLIPAYTKHVNFQFPESCFIWNLAGLHCSSVEEIGLCSGYSTGSQDHRHSSQVYQGQLRNFAALANSIANVIYDSLNLSGGIYSSFPKFQLKISKEWKMESSWRFASAKGWHMFIYLFYFW